MNCSDELRQAGKSWGKYAPCWEVAFLTPAKNVICPSGRISLDKTPYLSADPIKVGGGRCLPFGWKFQSKTDITIRFGASPTLDDPSCCPTDENDVEGKLAGKMMTLSSSTSGKPAGNIRGYRCYPGGRKELLVVHLVDWCLNNSQQFETVAFGQYRGLLNW